MSKTRSTSTAKRLSIAGGEQSIKGWLIRATAECAHSEVCDISMKHHVLRFAVPTIPPLARPSKDLSSP